MRTSRILRAATACVLFAVAALALAEENPADSLLPDFYNDPSLSTSGIQLEDYESSSVDHFSGTMRRSATDFVLPGNGGLAIEIKRNYTSLQPSSWPDYTAVGVGWTMHFGWVEITDIEKMCSPLWSISIMDNPMVHMPDGSSDVLALTDEPMADPTKIHYRGKSGVGVSCGAPVVGENAAPFIMVTPDGRRYEFERWSVGGALFGFNKTAKWFVKKIQDRHGNWIAIDYQDVGSQATGTIVAPVRVIGSDGREVLLEYGGGLLRRIVQGTDTLVEYGYEPADMDTGHYSNLVRVELREELAWAYNYCAKREAGAGSMVRATNPFGGYTDYTWRRQYFLTGDDAELNAVVAQVTQDAVGSPSATWLYTYTPATAVGARDVTTVVAPEGTYQYSHFSALGMVSGEVWKVGLTERVVFTPNNGPVKTEEFTWSPYYISAENNKRTKTNGIYAAVDTVYYGAVQSAKTTRIGTATWKVVSSDWLWGTGYIGQPQAQTVLYTGPDGTQRKQNRRFHQRPQWHLYFLPYQEWTTQALFPDATTSQTEYNDLGDAVYKFERGFFTFYIWDAQGNLASTTRGTNADGSQGQARVTTYADYHRGVARLTTHPDGTTTQVEVDDLGRTVASTNREGATTRYAYDGLGRVTLIDYPAGNDAHLVYAGARTTLTRGDYRRVTRTDGFGRGIEETHADSSSGRVISVQRQYDSGGRVVFTSMPNSTVAGSRYSYDDYGRVTRVVHPGGQRSYSYVDGQRVDVSDENGNVTQMHRLEVLGPGEGDVVKIVSPGNIVTRITRNEYGLPLKIEQGTGTTMKARTNTYNASLVLTASNDPELGTTTYGYDLAGNLTRITRPDGVTGLFDFQINEYDLNDRVVRTWVASNQLTSGSYKHTYDARLEFRWTAEGRPLEQARYQTIGHYYGSTSRGQDSTWNAWQFEYDANGNALVERAIINGISREFRYAWDGNDRLQALTYPDGYTLDYAPDAFGWPTRAGDYATAVRYHPTGQLAGFTYGNGRRIDLDVNERYLVSGIRVPGITELAYDYDPAGNVLSIVDQLDASRSVALQYTNLNRLASANGPWGAGSFVYDAWGNITRKNLGAEQLAYTYDSKNRMTRIASGGTSRAYAYDGFGNIKQIGSAWYGYDGLGNLIESRKDMALNANSVRATHEIDARNRRVATRRGDATNYFLQANGDRLLWEFEAVDNTWVRHVFLGNVQVARTENYVGCWDDLDGDGIPHCAEQEAGLNPRDATDAEGDRDGDGLANLDEYLRGTAINDSDTDNDGILDGVEVSVGMDPKVDDAGGDLDGDGIPNNVEFARGFNPADPADGLGDQDGDGLTSGAEYALGTAWDDADTDNDGFLDGYEVTYGLNPRLADAEADRDGDGLPNAYEQYLGFNPADPADGAADADHDGLSNGQEFAAGLELFVADTDGDGILDGVEVARGLSPRVHDSHRDKDGDGIPNAWELSHGMNPADASDGAADPDGDGVSIRDEYLVDTDPWQAEYLGPVSGIRVAPGIDGNIVAWAAQPRASDYVVRYGVLGETDAITLSGYADRALDHGGLRPDAIYWYQVSARDAGGTEIAGETVTALTGARQEFTLPVTLPTTCNHKPQIVLLGDGDFLFACEAGVDRLDMYRYRRGELRFQRSFVLPEQNENPGWSLVATEDGNAMVRWSAVARLEMRWFEFYSRFNVRRDQWTDPEMIVDFTYSWLSDIPEITFHGNWDGRYTAFHSEVVALYDPTSSQRRYQSRIYRSVAAGLGPWTRSSALVSGRRLYNLTAAGPDELVMRSYEQDSYMVERFRVEYLRRSGPSYVLQTLNLTTPWPAQLDASDKIFAFTRRVSESGGYHSAWYRGCVECADSDPNYGIVQAGSNGDTIAQLSVLAFGGVGYGQVLRVMPGAIHVVGSSMGSDNQISWKPSELLVNDPALSDLRQVIALRSRRNGWLLWNNDIGQSLLMEGRRDGTWSTPEVVSTGAPVIAADADHAGNLVYVLREAGQYVFRERRRQPSYVSADSDLTPPVVAHATVRTAGSTVRHVVTLSADEPANLFFRVSGGTVQAGGTNTTAEQRYIGPLTITVPNGSQATLVFRGINQARRWSAPVTVTLQ